VRLWWVKAGKLARHAARRLERLAAAPPARGNGCPIPTSCNAAMSRPASCACVRSALCADEFSCTVEKKRSITDRTHQSRGSGPALRATLCLHCGFLACSERCSGPTSGDHISLTCKLVMALPCPTLVCPVGARSQERQLQVGTPKIPLDHKRALGIRAKR